VLGLRRRGLPGLTVNGGRRPSEQRRLGARSPATSAAPNGRERGFRGCGDREGSMERLMEVRASCTRRVRRRWPFLLRRSGEKFHHVGDVLGSDNRGKSEMGDVG
jgi:hypothetical protein